MFGKLVSYIAVASGVLGHAAQEKFRFFGILRHILVKMRSIFHYIH